MKKTLLLLLCCWGFQQAKAQDKLAPFTLTTIDNQKVNIRDSEKITVFCSWDIKTEEVVQEAKTLNSLVEKYQDADVQFIAVTDSKAVKVQAYLADHPFLYQQVAGKEGKRVNKILGNSGLIRTYPLHIVIDKAGHIVQSAIGSCATVHELIDTAIHQ